MASALRLFKNILSFLDRFAPATITILLLLSLVLVGCVGDSVARRLEEAERIMDSDAGEALRIVESIDSAGDLRGRSRALYGVVLAWALDKSRRELPPDSLLSFSADYFLQKGDRIRAIKSLYYLGVASFRNGSYPPSIDVSLQALSLSREAGESHWAALSARNLADIFGMTYGGAEQTRYAREALDDFSKSSPAPFVHYALLDYASALNNNAMFTEAIPVAREAVDSAAVSGDENLSAEGYRIMGLSFIGLHDLSHAADCFEIVCSSAGATAADSCYLGEIYAEPGQTSQSATLLRQLGPPSDLHTWTLSYCHNKATGNYLEAMVALEECDSLINDVFISLLRQSVTGSLIDSSNKFRQEKEAEIRRLNFKLLFSAHLAAASC